MAKGNLVVLTVNSIIHSVILLINNDVSTHQLTRKMKCEDWSV